MNDWIFIRPEEFAFVGNDTEHPEKKDAVSMHFFISPYDLPIAMRTRINSDKEFVLQFKYIEDESVIYTNYSHGIKLGLGKVSARLIEICFDQTKLSQSTTPFDITLITNTIDELTQSGSRHSNKVKNYGVTKKIIQEKNNMFIPDYVSWARKQA